MIQRRRFLSLAAAAVPAAAVAALPTAAPAAGACLPDLQRLKSRTISRYEVLYQTKHGQPNALYFSNEGLWVLDQGSGHWVTLTKLEDGSVIREFQADVVGPSGLVIDDENVMWITSTHNSLIVAVDPANGKTIAKYITPGAARIYRMRDDPPNRVTKLKPAYPEASRAVGGAQNNVGNDTGAGLGPGQLAMDTEEGAGGTGAHGILAKAGNLIYACPPTRAIYVIDKRSWVVQHVWPTPGNRPHGISWADPGKTSFWNADSNLNAFFRYELASGRIVEKLQLGDDSPVIHGAKLVNGYMYCCDDVGWIWRFRM
jgi:sugar lactone lactonase YvrE